MSAASVVAVVAFLTAVAALFVSIRAERRLLETQAELESANATLDKERQATAEAIAAVHRSTVEEVTALLESVLAQVDTDITAKVAEALAVLSTGAASDVGEAHSLTETSTHEPTEPQARSRTGSHSSGPLAPAIETRGQGSDPESKAGNWPGGLC